jgi:hypothetical protein
MPRIWVMLFAKIAHYLEESLSQRVFSHVLRFSSKGLWLWKHLFPIPVGVGSGLLPNLNIVR